MALSEKNDGVFDRASKAYARVGQDFFAHFGDRIIAMTGVQTGSSLLDVGCGTGAGLEAAFAATAGTGLAVGVDVSEGMLRRIADVPGTPALARADAAKLPFPDDVFEVVVSCFALTYFAPPSKAVDEMRRVLAPGGVLGICVSDGWWYQGDPSWLWHEELLCDVGYAPTAPVFEDPSVTVDLLRRADLSPQEAIVEEFVLRWTDASEWWRWCWSHGYREVLEGLSPTALAAYQRRSFEHLDGGPVDGRLAVVLATAVLAAD